jgi:hypothetical protein
MSDNAIDSQNTSKPAPDVAKPKSPRKSKKAKSAKKAGRAKKPTAKPKADRVNKKTEVVAMMKRAKGATLPEIMKATGWQPRTVRGLPLVSVAESLDTLSAAGRLVLNIMTAVSQWEREAIGERTGTP